MSSQHHWNDFLNSRVSAKRKAQATLRILRSHGFAHDATERANVLYWVARAHS